MEKLNIAELLKDCPKGMELDCVLYNDVALHEVNLYNAFPIVLVKKNGDTFVTTKYGQYQNTADSKCVIFPKGKTTWEGFQRLFKDGDIVFYSNTITIFKEWGDETLFRTHCVLYTTVSNPIYQFEISRPLFGKDIRKEARFATEEEKQKLFDTIRANGYKWNAETKTLEEVKFKIGNWYQCTKDFLGKGVTFDKNTAYYCAIEGCLQDEYGCHIAIVKDLYDNFKLWTIEDAKDGDILVNNGKSLFLFKETKPSDIKTDCLNPLTVLGYCGIGGAGFTKGEGWGDTANCTYYPATEEQRAFLFKKIHEAGYRWNLETRTLEKLLVEPKFKVGDIIKCKDSNYLHIIKGIAGQLYVFDDYRTIMINTQDDYELVKFSVTGADRGRRDSIIRGLKQLEEDYMLSYEEEIEWLNQLVKDYETLDCKR